jgi:hypothetical protein
MIWRARIDTGLKMSKRAGLGVGQASARSSQPNNLLYAKNPTFKSLC